MTQYILKKDMPGCSAGTIFERAYNSPTEIVLESCDGPDIIQLPDFSRHDQEWFTEYQPLKRWRAPDGGYFWTIENLQKVNRWSDNRDCNPGRDDLYSIGCYFKSEETAELVLQAQNLFFKFLHTIPGTPQQNIKNQFEHAHANARKAVLEDDGKILGSVSIK